MNIRSLIILLITGLSLVMLGTCSTDHDHIILSETIEKADRPFVTSLSKRYIAYASWQKQRKQLDLSLLFKQRAQNITSGKTVLPLDLPTDIESDRKETFSIARKQVLLARNKSIRHHFPSIVAALQMSYDCWLTEYQLAVDLDKEYACREDFFARSDQVFTKAFANHLHPNIRLATQPLFTLRYDDKVIALHEAQKKSIEHVASQLVKTSSYDITINAYYHIGNKEEKYIQQSRAAMVQDIFVRQGLNPAAMILFIEPLQDALSNEIEVVIDVAY